MIYWADIFWKLSRLYVYIVLSVQLVFSEKWLLNHLHHQHSFTDKGQQLNLFQTQETEADPDSESTNTCVWKPVPILTFLTISPFLLWREHFLRGKPHVLTQSPRYSDSGSGPCIGNIYIDLGQILFWNYLTTSNIIVGRIICPFSAI